MLSKVLQLIRPTPRPDAPQGFGCTIAWYAVRSDEPAEVAQALGLLSIRPASWAAGMKAAYEKNAVFCTPPIHGWVLTAGTPFFPHCAAPEEERCLEVLRSLSARFGAAQYFASHRVIETHAWARAEKGKLRRAYCYTGESGETVWLTGSRSAGEARVDPEVGASEEHVTRTAACWSVDPTTIGDLALPPSLILVGRPPTGD